MNGIDFFAQQQRAIKASPDRNLSNRNKKTRLILLACQLLAAKLGLKGQKTALSMTSRSYSNFRHPAILHEYLLIWEKTAATTVQVVWDLSKSMLEQAKMTWQTLVRMALMALGGEASVQRIYAEVAKIGEARLKSNPTWKATVRRTLQEQFQNVERGVWAV